MAVVRRRIDEEILEPGKAQGLAERDYFHNRHLDNRCVYELLSHPNLVERAASMHRAASGAVAHEFPD